MYNSSNFNNKSSGNLVGINHRSGRNKLIRYTNSLTQTYNGPFKPTENVVQTDFRNNLTTQITDSYLNYNVEKLGEVLKNVSYDDIAKRHNNTAYIKFEIGLNISKNEKMRILSEYSSSSAVKHIKRNHMKKLNSVLSKPEYRGITVDDFMNYAHTNQVTGKSIVHPDKKDKIREMLSKEFKNEFNAIGAKIEKYSARNLFVKKIANDEKILIDLKSKGITDNQIKLMKEKGITPPNYTVHHKFPRFFTQKMGIKHNHPSNLILVKEGEESGDDFFHAFMDKQLNETKDKIATKERNNKKNKNSTNFRFNEHDLGVYLSRNHETMTMYISWPIGSVYLTDKDIEKKKEILKSKGEVYKPLSNNELLSKAINEASDVSEDMRQRQQNKDLDANKLGAFATYNEIKNDKFETKEQTAMKYALERAKNNQGR